MGLYFSVSTFGGCSAFTPKLLEVYQELKEKNENFEIVMIPLDDNEESFKEGFESLPWFSVPRGDRSCEKLVRYFELSSLPTLVIIGPDGKTLQSNVAEAVEEHGALAYPFTPEKFAELEEIEKAKKEQQTLESLLVKGEVDFVIGKDGVKVRYLILGYLIHLFLASVTNLISDENIADPSIRSCWKKYTLILLCPLVSSLPCFSPKTH